MKVLKYFRVTEKRLIISVFLIFFFFWTGYLFESNFYGFVRHYPHVLIVLPSIIIKSQTGLIL